MVLPVPMSAMVECGMPDKFSAVWVSHSSLKDFIACPKSYYYKNIYRDPKTKHKIKIMSPPLALGQAVHNVIESLSVIPTKDRFSESLVERFEHAWQQVAGKQGGFHDRDHEAEYRRRGEEMLLRVQKNPGPLVNQAVKIKEELPWYWLSEEKNIILCGKIDWLEYLPETDSVHIIDFKTGKAEEDGESLQLPIYHLLVHNTQKRPVTKASYWYIALQDTLTPKLLPDLDEAHETILEAAGKVKAARQLGVFTCPGDSMSRVSQAGVTATQEQPRVPGVQLKGPGCRCCRPYEAIIRGEGEYIGIDEYRADVYILPPKGTIQDDNEEESMIL